MGDGQHAERTSKEKICGAFQCMESLGPSYYEASSLLAKGMDLPDPKPHSQQPAANPKGRCVSSVYLVFRRGWIGAERKQCLLTWRGRVSWFSLCLTLASL